MTEENARAVRRLRDLLLGFGAAGREAVEQLKLSPNPAARRTAIELLRMFGGHECADRPGGHARRRRPAGAARGGARPRFTWDRLRRSQSCSGRWTPAPRPRFFRSSSVSATRKSHLCSAPSSRDRSRAARWSTSTRRSWKRWEDWAVTPIRCRRFERRFTAANGGLLRRTSALRRTAAAALRRIGTPDALAVLEEAATEGNARRQECRADADANSPAARATAHMSATQKAKVAEELLRRFAAALRAVQLYAPCASARGTQHRRARRDAWTRPCDGTVDRHRDGRTKSSSSATFPFRVPPKAWAS